MIQVPAGNVAQGKPDDLQVIDTCKRVLKNGPMAMHRECLALQSSGA
jgi:hypothetical protein